MKRRLCYLLLLLPLLACVRQEPIMRTHTPELEVASAKPSALKKLAMPTGFWDRQNHWRLEVTWFSDLDPMWRYQFGSDPPALGQTDCADRRVRILNGLGDDDTKAVLREQLASVIMSCQGDSILPAALIDYADEFERIIHDPRNKDLRKFLR